MKYGSEKRTEKDMRAFYFFKIRGFSVEVRIDSEVSREE